MLCEINAHIAAKAVAEYGYFCNLVLLHELKHIIGKKAHGIWLAAVSTAAVPAEIEREHFIFSTERLCQGI